MTTPTKKRFSWALIALVALLFAGVYSCNSNPPAEEKKEAAPPATSTPAPDSTSKSATDTTGKGGETPPPKN